jgi:hypothetical protein
MKQWRPFACKIHLRESRETEQRGQGYQPQDSKPMKICHKHLLPVHRKL